VSTVNLDKLITSKCVGVRTAITRPKRLGGFAHVLTQWGQSSASHSFAQRPPLGAGRLGLVSPSRSAAVKRALQMIYDI
jgi:hypothetical protein